MILNAVIALILRFYGIRQIFRPIIWQWLKIDLYNVRKSLSPSSSVLLLAKTITHPAKRSLCDSCASCIHSSSFTMRQNRTQYGKYLMCALKRTDVYSAARSHKIEEKWTKMFSILRRLFFWLSVLKFNEPINRSQSTKHNEKSQKTSWLLLSDITIIHNNF